MDADDGKYEGYQCDAAEKGDKCHVQKGGNIPKRMVTDGLASCVSINVISKKGTRVPDDKRGQGPGQGWEIQAAGRKYQKGH